ncbi:MAG: AAA family ATPase, partial [Verrucomicrobiae bacterium]|nr:AAA family ATPase [Verrucomicrobiae bacterium]
RNDHRFPAVGAVRAILSDWRFYHQFRTDADSPIRRAQVGSWSPVLHHDGSNLASAWQSIAESGFRDALEEAVELAFPGCQLRAQGDEGGFRIEILRPGLSRWLGGSELSDGTLRYLSLIAALLTPRPPRLLVLNEPEASLNEGLLAPLAEMIAKIPAETQLIVVTHSETLATAISERIETTRVRLISYEGETRLEGQGGARRVWTFDD